MFDEDEEKAKKRRDIVIGSDLSTLSVDELDERIELLKAEIGRIEEEKKQKQSSLSAAEAFFKN